jgi:hypothetical protein
MIGFVMRPGRLGHERHHNGKCKDTHGISLNSENAGL